VGRIGSCFEVVRLSSDTGNGRIPKEVLDFFRSPGGHSLIIKGDAGTGKTTFALQLIEELSQEQPEYYLSMRVSDEALFRQFPWLREKAKRNEILKAGKAFLKKTSSFEKEEVNPKQEATLRATKNLLRALTVTDSNPSVVRTELNKLEGQVEAGEIDHDEEDEYNVMAPDGSLIMEIGAMLPELELAYDITENNLPKRSLIILDSIEALSEIYGISAVRIMNVLQKDLVEHSDTNIIYVLETSGKSIMDYLGDGVLILDSGERGGRRIRQLIIEKLRGGSIHRWKYMFTLQDGRLSVFDQDSEGLPIAKGMHVAVPDPNERAISFGCSTLDKVMGGMPRGGMTLIEIDQGVPQSAVQWLETSMIVDHLTKGRGLVWNPLYSLDYAEIEKRMKAKLDKPSMLEGLNILDTSNQSTNGYPFLRAIEGTDASHDLRWDSLKYMLSRSEAPYLSILGFDSMEATYGGDVLPQTFHHIDAMRRGGHVVVAEATPISKSLPHLANQATMHLKLESVNGTVLLCGQKPYTPYYHLEIEIVDGKECPKLVPMV
jgi:KaiC/GvpD/RAD55 family RecA-like ATPase